MTKDQRAQRAPFYDDSPCPHCGCRYGYHEVGCPELIDEIVEKVTTGFADDVKRIMADHPEAKPGDLTTEQQCQMIAEASAWRARALKAESALAAFSDAERVGEEWPERAIRIAEELENQVMSVRNDSLFCRLCGHDCGADGQAHASHCVLFNDALSASLNQPAASVVEGEEIARLFHDTYERLAPQFGYETRPDTKAFDPTTPNGRLMIAVCSQIAGVIQRGTISDCGNDALGKVSVRQYDREGYIEYLSAHYPNAVRSMIERVYAGELDDISGVQCFAFARARLSSSGLILKQDALAACDAARAGAEKHYGAAEGVGADMARRRISAAPSTPVGEG